MIIRERHPLFQTLYPLIVVLLLVVAAVIVVQQQNRILTFFGIIQPILFVVASELSIRISQIRTEYGRILTLLMVYIGMSILSVGALWLFFVYPPDVSVKNVVPVSPTPYLFPTPLRYEEFSVPVYPTIDQDLRCLGQCNDDPNNTSYPNRQTCIGVDNLCYQCVDGRFYVVPVEMCQN